MKDEYSIGVRGLPLKIDSVPVPSLPGLIGISICPGMKEFSTLDLYDDRIENDLQCICNWGATMIVNLLEAREIVMLGVTALPGRILSKNIKFMHLPMANSSVPDEGFESKWSMASSELRQVLQQGERILIHCREGVGRSALVAARLLIDSGIDAGSAISAVRKARPGSFMLHAQEKYCHSLTSSVTA
jgi:ADP-ribosyl-[dinitrogen reductase] hydrolase